MSDQNDPKAHSRTEKAFAPFAFAAGSPTNPHIVPFAHTAPDGLVLVHSAPTPSEADLTRQVLQDAGFHVEYVPAVTTGIFGTSGSAQVYVAAGEEAEVREFLSQLWQTAEDR